VKLLPASSLLLLEQSNFLLSEDMVKLYLSVTHQMHLMAKFGYASSHSANRSASLQNLVDNKESRDQIIIYWPDKKYTCTNEGGGSVLILRRPGFLSRSSGRLNTAAAELFYLHQEAPGMIPCPTSPFGRAHFDPARIYTRH
jgi:hypothetical protein